MHDQRLVFGGKEITKIRQMVRKGKFAQFTGKHEPENYIYTLTFMYLNVSTMLECSI